MKSKFAAVLFLLLMLSVVAVNAAGPAAYGDSVKYIFNPVVVTATKIQGPQNETASSVSVISQSEIDHAVSSSVLELVSEQVPGVFITEKNIMGYGVATGAAGGISIRGVGGTPVTGVLVLRDGRPDMMGMMGHPIPDAYSLDGVERIEVVRGPASFLYGTNAMGGVINIVSKTRHEDGFTTNITGGLGNYGSQKLTGVHGGKIGKFDYYLSASTRNTDGHRDYSSYEGDFYTLHAGYQLLPTSSVSLNANLSNVTMFDPGTIDAALPTDDQWYDLKRSGVDLTLDHKSGLGESFLKVHGNFGTHKIYDGWRSNDHTVGVMFYHNLKPTYGNTMTIGFDAKQYGGDAKESLGQVPYIHYDERTITEWAPYIHSQQTILQNVIASAGLRMENHELYGNELLPKAGLVYLPFAKTSLRVSAAKGFRSPSIRELYIFPPRNENLEPERMWNYEFGWTQDITLNLNVEGVLFRSEGENMIRTAGMPPNMQFSNSDEFVHTGYELVAKWVPMPKLYVTANWTKLDLEDETMQTPGKKLGATVSYTVPYVNFSATLQHIMDLYGADKHVNPMADYTLVNFSALVNPPVPYVSFKVSVKNLLDEEYQTFYGYPMPGRTFMLDMSVGI